MKRNILALLIIFLFVFISVNAFAGSLRKFKKEIENVGGKPYATITTRKTMVKEGERTVVVTKEFYMYDGSLIILGKDKRVFEGWEVIVVTLWGSPIKGKDS